LRERRKKKLASKHIFYMYFRVLQVLSQTQNRSSVGVKVILSNIRFKKKVLIIKKRKQKEYKSMALLCQTNCWLHLFNYLYFWQEKKYIIHDGKPLGNLRQIERSPKNRMNSSPAFDIPSSKAKPTFKIWKSVVLTNFIIPSCPPISSSVENLK